MVLERKRENEKKTDGRVTIPSPTEKALFVVTEGHGRDGTSMAGEHVNEPAGIVSDGKEVDVS